MPDRLDPTFVRAQIALLRVTHPNIWDEGDEQLLADMLEGETGLHEFLAAVVRRRLTESSNLGGADRALPPFLGRQR